MVAPWPGLEPGSSGRQPLILDRTILPGLPKGQDAKSLHETRVLLKFN